MCIRDSTQGQYVFLHDAILEGYTSGDTEIMVDKLGKRMTELEAEDDEGISGFRKEFEVSICFEAIFSLRMRGGAGNYTILSTLVKIVVHGPMV